MGLSPQEKYNFYKNYIKKNLSDFSNAKISNIKDYADNIIRYFSLTSLLRIRGNGYYIDIAPSRRQYLKKILLGEDGSSNNFKSKKEYLNYLVDMTLPLIELDNKEIRNEYINEITKLIKENDILLKELMFLKKYDLKQLINLKKRVLFKLEKKQYLNKKGLTKIINSLEGIRNLEIKPSLALERWISTSLITLNDDEEIKPNYSSDENNNIIFTAPPLQADIECYYKEFNLICEVTMLVGRDQWHNEGQPVMRHFSDFIRKQKNNKENYCLFIAPRIHRDTLNTFWYSLKYEYEGLNLKIIPFSLKRFEEIIYSLRILYLNNISFSRHNLKELFDLICNVTNINSSLEW